MLRLKKGLKSAVAALLISLPLALNIYGQDKLGPKSVKQAASLLMLPRVPQAFAVPNQQAGSLLYIFGESDQDKRTASGIIYFTNNSPDSWANFRIEVLTPNKKKLMAAAAPDDHHRFEFRALKPARYLLRVTWPNRCVLSYRMDLTKESRTEIRVLMDLECAHFNGRIRDLPSE
jgi:hypothetical protein